MGIQIAHFPAVKALDDFDFELQPSVDHKLARMLATGRFIAGAGNLLLFGPPGVGKTHLAIALGRAAVEAGQLRALRHRDPAGHAEPRAN
jgi:DNA replication protein DnaC